MPLCPSGHDSATDDYCDVCGARIAAPAVPPPSPQPAETCPGCGSGRTGRFCEECGYDFALGPARDPDPPSPATGTWSAVVTADRAYFDGVRAQDGPDAGTVQFPSYCPERRFVLSGTQLRIGRATRSRGIQPEIDLTGPPADPGVSHLHALLVAQPDGGWALVDPGSTNGTTLNDDPEPLVADTPVPLADGDRIHLGAWTTITVIRTPGEPTPTP